MDNPSKNDNDLAEYEVAMVEHKANPKTYTQDEVEQILDENK